MRCLDAVWEEAKRRVELGLGLGFLCGGVLGCRVFSLLGFKMEGFFCWYLQERGEENNRRRAFIEREREMEKGFPCFLFLKSEDSVAIHGFPAALCKIYIHRTRVSD